MESWIDRESTACQFAIDLVPGQSRGTLLAVPLQELTPILDTAGVPREVAELLVEADRRCDEFFAAGLGRRYPRYLPSDPSVVYAAMAGLRSGGRLRGDVFCEWGCGFGVATCIASLIGFEAYGIEIEPELVETASDLAERFDSRATFVEGSFVPVDYRSSVSLLEADFLTLTEGPDAFEELGMEIADFDVVYAYPWPGEEEWLEELVRRHAGERTMLLTYSVSDGFRRTQY